MWKNMAQPRGVTEDNILWHMHFAFWMCNATGTSS